MDTRSKSEECAINGTTAAPGLLTESSFRSLDHAKEAWIARATGALSPAALALAFADWFIHVLAAPGKQLQLATLAICESRRLLEDGSGTAPLEHTLPSDDRFRASGWQMPLVAGLEQVALCAWLDETHLAPAYGFARRSGPSDRRRARYLCFPNMKGTSWTAHF